MDIEAQVFGGLRWAGRVGLAFDVRYGIASPVTVRRRPIEPDVGFTPLPPLEPVRWRPGNYLEYAISPHLLLTPQLSLGLLYRSHARQADTFDGSARDLSPLSLETEATVQSLGVDVRYSSFRGGGFPLDVWFGWESARGRKRRPDTKDGASAFRGGSLPEDLGRGLGTLPGPAQQLAGVVAGGGRAGISPQQCARSRAPASPPPRQRPACAPRRHPPRAVSPPEDDGSPATRSARDG